MVRTSNKASFIRYGNPDRQIALERRMRSWMPHTVAVLVVSPGGDQIAAALPGAARRNDAEYILSPPQLRMSSEVIQKVSRFAENDVQHHVQATAMIIAREFLNMTEVRAYNDQHFFALQGRRATVRNRMWYVGTTRGNDHRYGRVVKYGKFFHWVVIQLDRYRDVFRKDSVMYQDPQWINVSRLAAMPQSMSMSQRKFEMIDQVLLEYGQITGNYNKLVRAANERQHTIA